MTNKEIKEELMNMTLGEIRGRHSQMIEQYNKYKVAIQETAQKIAELNFDDSRYGYKMTNLLSDINGYKSEIKFYENWLKIADPILNKKESEGINKAMYEKYMKDNQHNINIILTAANDLKQQCINNNTNPEITTKMIEESFENMIEELMWILQDRIGNITDIIEMQINGHKAFDGVFKGDKGTIRINTVLAGGYNIQRLHFRTLVYNY